jgi:F-type H+-transporting ATPase subunit b
MNLPLNIDIQQILLHLLNFTILFGILYFLLYSPVKKFMEKREQYYKDMDAEAKGEL